MLQIIDQLRGSLRNLKHIHLNQLPNKRFYRLSMKNIKLNFHHAQNQFFDF